MQRSAVALPSLQALSIGCSSHHSSPSSSRVNLSPFTVMNVTFTSWYSLSFFILHLLFLVGLFLQSGTSFPSRILDDIPHLRFHQAPPSASCFFSPPPPFSSCDAQPPSRRTSPIPPTAPSIPPGFGQWGLLHRRRWSLVLLSFRRRFLPPHRVAVPVAESHAFPVPIYETPVVKILGDILSIRLRLEVLLTFPALRPQDFPASVAFENPAPLSTEAHSPSPAKA